MKIYILKIVKVGGKVVSVNIRVIIEKINNSCDHLEFIEARRLIELNFEKLKISTYYNLLNMNARTLIKHIMQEYETNGGKSLERVDLLKINDINKYCQQFDISMLKRALKDSMDLIQRPDVQKMLHENSKFILETMGALLINAKVKEEVR